MPLVYTLPFFHTAQRLPQSLSVVIGWSFRQKNVILKLKVLHEKADDQPSPELYNPRRR